MNRTGSLVVQDSKGRDRERYPIVYGARLKVRDGEPVEPGQILVEWDPYTFSILTEDAGSVKYKDLITDVTYHEEVDEVTGLSRKIVVDSPDEKKQPMIEVRDKAGKVTRKYHMPSHAHLMVEDNEAVFAGPGAREDSARDDQDEGHHGRSAARGRALRGAQAA